MDSILKEVSLGNSNKQIHKYWSRKTILKAMAIYKTTDR